MTDDTLIAEVQSTRQPWTGAGLLDSTQALVETIQSESWVDASLAGGSLALEAVGSAMDPFSALLANGLGWAMEFFEPLREILDWLTGKPDVVASHASTWYNMSEELYGICEELQSALSADLPSWTGDAAEAYHKLMGNNVEAVVGLGGTAAAMASATEGAGGLVAITRDIVRELIADLVARVIVWSVEAIFVVTIPIIAEGIIAAVVKWTGTILGYVTALVSSLQNLQKLLDL